MRCFVAAAWGLFVLVGAAGCGDHSAHQGDDDHTGEPGMNAAAIGLSLRLSQPESTTLDFGARSCPASEITYTLGAPKARGTIPNGVTGVLVSCTVTATGAVSAQASGYDTQTRQKLSLNFAGALDDSLGAVSTAAVGFYSAQTQALYTDSPTFPECTVDLITVLKPGAVLADFSCPLLVAPDDATSGCAARGSLAIEYCSTGAEE